MEELEKKKEFQESCCKEEICSPRETQKFYTENCMICGNKLDYLKEGVKVKCHLCGREELGYIICQEGHYVCDNCHGQNAFEVVKDITFKSNSKDPFQIAEEMMDHPSIPMLGCEHSYLVAAAFLRALQNEGTLKITDEQIIDAMKRADKISIAGYCGLAGTCGIASGMAAAFSVMLGTTCATDKEMSITFQVMARVTEALANESGPCCCKNFARTAIGVGYTLAKTYLNVSLPIHKEKIVCHHMKRLKGGSHPCKTTRCPYFPKSEPKNNVTREGDK